MKMTPTFALSLSTLIIMAASCGAAAAQEPEKAKPRVFITDSKSWELAGGFSATSEIAVGAVRGGARPQTAEVIKTFGEKCPDVTVTMKADKADYVVLLEHEGGKPGLHKDNKFAVFKSDGDAIKSGSTRTVGGAVKDSCEALMKDWRPDSENPAARKSK
jgi:hypothetical protein